MCYGIMARNLVVGPQQMGQFLQISVKRPKLLIRTEEMRSPPLVEFAVEKIDVPKAVETGKPKALIQPL